MKLLVFLVDSYLDPDICDVFARMHIEYDTVKYSFVHEFGSYVQDEFVENFIRDYNVNGYDGVFSIDFWPSLAMATYKKNIKYIAWSYDCPLNVINPEETLSLPNVFCFLFDRQQTEYYKNKGIENVFYLPLGVNAERYKKIDRFKRECDKYRGDISFVGKIYRSSYQLIHSYVNENTAKTLDAILEMQDKMRYTDILCQVLTDDFISLISKEMHENNTKFIDSVTKGKIQYAIESELTRRERILILNLCGKRYKTDFYSDSTFDLLEGVSIHPYVNYLNEMPWVFAASKINLNPTLRAIHSGISLRVFDVTACGGFLLINRQPELQEMFIDGKEVVAYDDIYDFVDKIDYYMNHESEREAIAMAGRNRCLSDYTMEKRIEEILNKVF